MTVTVKLFAVLRDRAGLSEAILQALPGSTALNVSKQLAVQFPNLAPLLSKVAYAVNEQYVAPDTELHDGDVLALIPPVSGG